LGLKKVIVFFVVFLIFYVKLFCDALTVMLAADIAAWTVPKDEPKSKYLREERSESAKKTKTDKN
jgi:hypothetical protein